MSRAPSQPGFHLKFASQQPLPGPPLPGPPGQALTEPGEVPAPPPLTALQQELRAVPAQIQVSLTCLPAG